MRYCCFHSAKIGKDNRQQTTDNSFFAITWNLSIPTSPSTSYIRFYIFQVGHNLFLLVMESDLSPYYGVKANLQFDIWHRSSISWTPFFIALLSCLEAIRVFLNSCSNALWHKSIISGDISIIVILKIKQRDVASYVPTLLIVN